MQHAANTAGTIIMKCEDFEPHLSRGKNHFWKSMYHYGKPG